jgi:hypothetical protein
VIHFAAGVNFFSVFDFKKCDPLMTTLEEALPAALVIDLHAEEVDVKLLGAGEVLDVKYDVIDTGNLKR